jgi:hypothetical protein
MVRLKPFKGFIQTHLRRDQTAWPPTITNLVDDVRNRFGLRDHQINPDVSDLVSLKCVAVHCEQNDGSLRCNFAKLRRCLRPFITGIPTS